MSAGRIPTTANSPLTAKGDLFTYSTAPARLAVGNNGEQIVADSAQTTGLGWSANFAAGKNKIINGDFRINQRAFTSATTSGYCFDRWQAFMSGGTVTASTQAFTPGAAPVAGYESINYARIVSSSQVGVSDYAAYVQKIEDVRTLANQTATVSFWAKASTGTPNIGISIVQVFGSGGSATVYTSPAVKTITTSWVRYSFTISVPSISGKTVGSNSSLDCWIFTSAGSSISAAGYAAVGLQNNTFDIWGVQVEAGSVATAFQTATGTLQGELAAAQRYYYRIANGQAYSVFGAGAGSSATVIRVAIPTHTTMRVSPTSVDYSGVTAWDYSGGAITFTSLALANLANNPDNPQIDITGTGITTHRPYYLVANNNVNAYLGLSAEL